MSAEHLVGDIVTARGREWVVQPGSTPQLLVLQPLGGNPAETTALLPAIEPVRQARFDPPTSDQMGDHGSAWLMRAAARIGNPNATGPFRCLGRIGVQPRPYQYVPLLMALRQPVVRLLVADDVGVGKTVESLLIARELMDRGEIEGFCVLCPPHLAEQWKEEIEKKFHLEAELYLSRTADRIHRNLPIGESPFKRHPIMVASIDFVKQESRRDTFLQHAPRFIIVDEAHTATSGNEGNHLRYELVERLSRDANRHLVLVTATPHTGNEDAFVNLVSILNPELRGVAASLTTEANRRRLSNHMVQRRRGDIQDYLEKEVADGKTKFPDLLVKESTYQLHAEAKALLVEMVDAVRAQYDGAKGDREKRVQWWSLLSMVRAFASSPKALAATLTERSALATASSTHEVDRRGMQALMVDEEDTVLGAGVTGEYREWAERALTLAGKKDLKLRSAKDVISDLLKESRGVIVFCQFIQTAQYVSEYLAAELKGATVDYVTGEMDGDDRRDRIAQLQKHPKRVLVATDCLSEGINLQEGFDAVIHYDLAWNPTRHEQREGRVDRYGQQSRVVRSVMYYGKDNLIDGIVLDVLLRKHDQIRRDIQIRVPVPRNHADVTQAIMDSLLLRKRGTPFGQTSLASYGSDVKTFHTEWEKRGEREKASRTMFAHAGIREQDVADAIKAAQDDLGALEVPEFVKRVLGHTTMRGSVTKEGDAWKLGVGNMDADIQHSIGLTEEMLVRFEPDPTKPGEHLHRGHPLVQNLCQYTIETAIDNLVEGPAARSSAITTAAVSAPTTLVVARYRYRLRMKGVDRLMEDIVVLGTDTTSRLLPESNVGPVLAATPSSNMSPADRAAAVEAAVGRTKGAWDAIKADAATRCREAKRLHEKVRDTGDLKLGAIEVTVNGEPDILGVYAYLPKGSKS